MFVNAHFFWRRIHNTQSFNIRQSCIIKQMAFVYYVCRSIRRSTEPFGGIQLIVSGDFLQLPPVTKGKDKANFCFQVLLFSFKAQTKNNNYISSKTNKWSFSVCYKHALQLRYSCHFQCWHSLAVNVFILNQLFLLSLMILFLRVIVIHFFNCLIELKF